MEHKDDQFKDMMKMSKVEIPFGDFEDRLMADIRKTELTRQSVMKTKKHALIFFIGGTIFGFGLNYLLTDMLATANISATMKSSLLMLSQLVYVLLIVLFSDKIHSLVKVSKEKKI